MASTQFPPDEVKEINQEVASLLKSRKETVSVAETAAGGIVSASLLSVPGASVYYKGGLTLYTLDSRIAYGGWTAETKATYSGPSPAIVAGLATSVRAKLQSTYTLCESGTAGPTGGSTRSRTPGYVALAIACERGVFTREVETGVPDGEGMREANMVAFAREALVLLRDVIKGEAGEPSEKL